MHRLNRSARFVTTWSFFGATKRSCHNTLLRSPPFYAHIYIIMCMYALSNVFFSFLFFFCADLRGTAPEPLVQASPTFGHTQGSFRIAAPPPEVHKRRRQIGGGLSSEGDISVVLGSACLDSTYSGHHLLHTVYPRSEVFSRSSRYSKAQPKQVEAKHGFR